MDLDEMPTQQRAPGRRATAKQPVKSARGKSKQPLVRPTIVHYQRSIADRQPPQFDDASEEEEKEDEDDEEEEEEEPVPKKGRGRAAAASTKNAPKKAPARMPAKSTTKTPARRGPTASQSSTGRGITQSQLA